MTPELPSASETALAIRRREVSCRDVVEAQLERIHRYNPSLNAVVTLDEEGARDRAAKADEALAGGQVWGPLHGVPITIKDAFETAGLRTTAGYGPLATNVPAQDAPLVARLRAAGAVIVGKTNLPPLASGNQTSNPIFGRTNNPWDLACTPGGSSGGSAAAVAAGLCGFDLGSDAGGSIRGPAHLCGVYGLKTTAGRLPLAGQVGSARLSLASAPIWEVMRQFPVAGPLARSVADLRLAFTVLGESWAPAVERWTPPSAAGLRIAWSNDLGGLPLLREIRESIAGAMARLETAGTRTDRQPSPGVDLAEAWEVTGKYIGAFETRRNPLARRLLFRIAGPLLVRRMGGRALERAFFEGARLGDDALHELSERRQRLIAGVDDFLEKHDAWVCPASPVVAYRHSRPASALVVEGERVAESFMDLAFCGLFNLTGHPVVVIPIGASAEGKPIGVQIVGRRGGEMPLLDVAAAVDEVIHGYRRPPGY
ncbi:MAG TPA: amidase [Anaeromyxobacter sp.]|nr:amidase [Anaeromyxobacter sp.]